MVAINKPIFTVLVALVASLSAASAQQIQPRIAGLEANSRYMTLLEEDDKLSQREDSITLVVESLREAFRLNAQDASGSREQIISNENQLFELRSRKAVVVDSLTLIEQAWVLNNMGATQPEQQEQAEFVASSVNVKYIYESPNVVDNLSAVDFKNLVKAEQMESQTQKLSDSYALNYDNMLSLSRSYASTSTYSDAAKIKHNFDSLNMANIRIVEELNDKWGFIYDNKSFAYSLLMELLGFTDVLQQEAELMRKAQAEISTKQQGVGGDNLMKYLVQKSSMVEYEALVASKLELRSVADSLQVLSKMMSTLDKTSPTELSITERLFIEYEPIKFSKSTTYSTANPIPATKIYDKGVIFRIFVGSFQTKPAVTAFRNTTPVSHMVNELKRHCYYIGGFETFEEAEQAQAELKKHGFRAPKIVVWSDGKERNLSSDPLPYSLSTSYRVEITNTPTLPSGTNDIVSSVGAEISKVGNDKFVVTSLLRGTQVDSLVNGLEALDPSLRVMVEKSVPKIEF